MEFLFLLSMKQPSQQSLYDIQLHVDNHTFSRKTFRQKIRRMNGWIFTGIKSTYGILILYNHIIYLHNALISINISKINSRLLFCLKSNSKYRFCSLQYSQSWEINLSSQSWNNPNTPYTCPAPSDKCLSDGLFRCPTLSILDSRTVSDYLQYIYIDLNSWLYITSRLIDAADTCRSLKPFNFTIF